MSEKKVAFIQSFWVTIENHANQVNIDDTANKTYPWTYGVTFVDISQVLLPLIQEELLQGYKDMLREVIEPAMQKEFDPPSTGIDCDVVDDPYGSIGRYLNPKFNPTTGDYEPGIFMYDGSKPEEK